MAILAKNPTIDRIPFLVLPAGDNAYLLRDVIPTKWSMSLDSGMSEVFCKSGETKYYSALRTITGDISFVANYIEITEGNANIPTALDSYSVSDLMRAVNKKLRERDVR